MKLKSGDKIILRTGNLRTETTVVGFRCYGMETEAGLVPFNPVLFYSCGYTTDKHVYALKKEFHYPLAIICEWIRIKIIKLKDLLNAVTSAIKRIAKFGGGKVNENL